MPDQTDSLWCRAIYIICIMALYTCNDSPVNVDALIFCHYGMYHYGRPSVSWFTFNYMHRYSWKGWIKTHTFFLIILMEILWYNSAKSHFGSTTSSCGSKYSIHWSSRLCVVLVITGVSVFMLLMKFLWHLSVFRYVSRYASYHDLCVKIWIVSWGTRIITSLAFYMPIFEIP